MDRVTHKLDDFFLKFPTRDYIKKTIILEPNVVPSGIFYIVSGVIRRYWISESGEEFTLNLYKPRTFLPMSWAIANVPNLHFYETMTDVQVKRAPKDSVLIFLKENPDIMYDLLRRVYIGMEGLWIHFESLTAGDSYIKLVSSIVILTKRFGKQEKESFIIQLKMNGTDIANYAGMSRETTSRELQRLKKENLVTFEKGVIIVHNLKKLNALLSI